MRKAFDTNVPKLRPRLRPAMAVVSEAAPETQEELTEHPVEQPTSEDGASDAVSHIVPENESDSSPVENDRTSSITDESVQPEAGTDITKEECVSVPEEHETVAANIVKFPASMVRKEDGVDDDDRQDAAVSNRSAHTEVTPAPIDDSDARRKRLENVKRKVAEAVRPEVQIEPVPQDPVLAAESVLGLVSDLEAQLSRSRDLEKVLRSELAEAKAELTRTVNDGRSASGRLAQTEALLDEKRKVLEELLFEMGALEQERDQAVRMVQMLTAKDRERQLELDDLGHRCTEIQRALDESIVEEGRLTGELDECIEENTRLHALLAEISRERDDLLGNVAQLTRERDELIESKKALEKVHHALSQARARLRE